MCIRDRATFHPLPGSSPISPILSKIVRVFISWIAHTSSPLKIELLAMVWFHSALITSFASTAQNTQTSAAFKAVSSLKGWKCSQESQPFLQLINW